MGLVSPFNNCAPALYHFDGFLATKADSQRLFTCINEQFGWHNAQVGLLSETLDVF
jgi:hypothetical protein